jgi:hypothetical protein
MGKWTRKIDESEYKLGQEIGESAVREFLDYYSTGLSPDAGEEAEKEADAYFSRLVDAYRRGKLENMIDDKTGFTVILHCKNDQEIRFRELHTKDREVMEKYGETQAQSRVNALLGKLCGEGVSIIEALSRPDYKICEALAVAFLLA